MTKLFSNNIVPSRRPRRPHPVRRLLLMGGAALIVLLSAGCQAKYHDVSAFIVEPRPIVTSTEYRMAPPDVVLITSKRVREINGHQEAIRTDGKLTLPLVGSVYVAGKTPEEIAAELETLAKEYYEDADVSVRVIGYRSKRVYVFGQVGMPGPYPYDGANTVLSTLARATPNHLADPARILVLRPNADGELIRRMTIDLNKMVREGDIALDAVLEEGDIIYVPPNPLAAIGMAFQQVLLPIQPAAQTMRGPTDIYDYTHSEPYRSESGQGYR